MTRNLKDGAPVRELIDVGPGDYALVGGLWKRITYNSAEGRSKKPLAWTITTEDEQSYTNMSEITRFALAADLELPDQAPAP